MQEEELQLLKVAGAAALTFNAPLSVERAAALVEWLGAADVSAVVDLGCGRGALARMVAEHLSSTSVTGVDDDAVVIGLARQMAEARGLGHQLTFTVGDAARWMGTVDAAVCVGVSHVFGGPTPMLERLTALPGVSRAIIGDGIWQDRPDAWCLDIFGPLPDGIDQLASIAASTRWSVEGLDCSTVEEWDVFEHGWIAGVRSVRTPSARTFADQRTADYQRYRGVLGFGWLQLSR